MSKQIAKLLKADLNSASNLAMIAKMLEKKGRANDTILAHISSKEAKLLKELGGAGTVNPETGLLEFYDGEGVDYTYAPDQTAAETARLQGAEDRIQATRYSPETATQEDISFGPGKVPEGVLIDPNTGQSMPTRYEPSGASAPTFFRESGVYSPAQGSAQIGVNTQIPSPIPYVATSADRAALLGEAGYGAKASPAELAAAPSAPGKSVLESLGLGDLKSQDLIRLGLAGGLGTLGYAKSKQAAKQAEQAVGEQKALAQPYQTQGQELIRAAQAGELSPTGQQALQAQRAQLAQGVEARGGVGAAQAAAQAEAFRQQLLQTQYNYGLQIAQVGDSIALGAIKTGLQADQQVNQATQNFYTSLAMVAGGIPMVRA